MERIIEVTSKLKYLGLLGLPMLYFDAPIFKYLWLFWMFAFVEIFYNLPIFFQSLKQLLGILYIYLSHGLQMPSAINFCSKVKYSLPFNGDWVVVNGGIQKEFSHSWGIPTQRYAYDFIIIDDQGKSCNGEKTKLTSYYCYAKDVLAPADGEVVDIGNHCIDSKTYGNGKVDNSAKDIRGNYVVIRHAEREYSITCHLLQNSITVKNGECVKRGQPIAKCGNTGNTSEPHIHFHLQDGKSMFSSAGLPISFENINITQCDEYKKYDKRIISKLFDERSQMQYIGRGQKVSNKEHV